MGSPACNVKRGAPPQRCCQVPRSEEENNPDKKEGPSVRAHTARCGRSAAPLALPRGSDQPKSLSVASFSGNHPTNQQKNKQRKKTSLHRWQADPRCASPFRPCCTRRRAAAAPAGSDILSSLAGTKRTPFSFPLPPNQQQPNQAATALCDRKNVFFVSKSSNHATATNIVFFFSTVSVFFLWFCGNIARVLFAVCCSPQSRA